MTASSHGLMSGCLFCVVREHVRFDCNGLQMNPIGCLWQVSLADSHTSDIYFSRTDNPSVSSWASGVCPRAISAALIAKS